MFVITENVDESSPAEVIIPERKTIMKKQEHLIVETTSLNKKVETISEQFQSEAGESDLEKEFN